MILNKRFYSSYTFGNPFCLRFLDGEGDDEGDDDGGDVPVTSVDLGAVKSVKGDDGNNFFTDKHLEKLGLWGSDDPTKAKFKTKDGKLDVTKLTKSYLELEERLAKASNPLPENASEAERFEHRKMLQKMGNVPATPEEYEFLYPDKLPDGIEISKEDEIALKVLCHKHNISKEAAQAFIDMDFKRKVRDTEAYSKAVNEQNDNVETRLKAEMGPEDFVENGKLMRRFMRKHFSGEDADFEKVYGDIKTTLFRGGAETKMVIAKALSEAARLAEGAGSSIYTQYQQQMTEKEQLKKEFPKSHAILED